MQFTQFNTNKAAFLANKEFSYDSDDENDLGLGKNASIPEKPLKSINVPTNTGGIRKKSILKASKNYDRSSSDEILPRGNNNYFLDKGNFHLEAASEISEIEKVTSIMNKTDDQIVKEENSQAENTPQHNHRERLPTKIPNFGLLSKFSPDNKEHIPNQSLDISSPLSQDQDPKQESEKIIGNVIRINNTMKFNSPPAIPLEIHDIVGNSKTQKTTDRNNLMETPLFKDNKNRQTTESNSNNPNSLTVINNEEQGTVYPGSKDPQSKASNSEQIESYARKLNDSMASRRPPKKTTFFANEAKNGHIIPGYTRYVLDDNLNQQQVYMPHFSDREISEAFGTLDMNKDGYVTSDEIAYFLEVLEENATEAEIEEMIRMLDYEGTGRVRYEEFYKMSTGKNLNPIGQAYPPTLDLFEKKRHADSARRMKIDTYVEPSSRKEPPKNSTNREQGVSRADVGNNYSSKHYGKIDSKLSKLPRLGDLGDEGVKYKKTDKDETDSYFKGFIRQAGLNTKTFMEKYDIVEFSNEQRISKVTYKDFLGFFCIDDQDVTKKIFSTIGKDRNHIDLRQVMIALSLYLEFQSDEKIQLAYDLFDPEGHGYILYNELMKCFKMFQLGEENKKIERKIKAILNRRSVRRICIFILMR